MKRSFVTVLAMSSFLAIGACGGDDTDVEVEPVEEVPAPAPAPLPPPIDTLMTDTTVADTTHTGL